MDALLTLRNNLVFLLSLQVRQLGHGLADDSEAFADLLFADYQGRSEANDVLVGWFGLFLLVVVLTREGGALYQQALALQKHAQIPSRMTAGFGLINDNSIQQAFSPY